MTATSTLPGVHEQTPMPRLPVKGKQASVWSRAVREWRMYALIIPGLLYFLVFAYLPLLGNIAAFQNYSPFLGFRHSPWVGIGNFIALFTDPQAITAIKNTLIISGLQIIFAFPAPIALALLLNSLMSGRVKRLVQSVVYLPHFIGWVVVVAIWTAMLGGAGAITHLEQHLGLGAVNVMTNPSTFKGLVTAQVIWKEVGWGTIIFLAAITTIPLELYESAAIDGAGAWRRLRAVTLPGISGIIVLLLILRLGSVLTVGFEQIVLQQPAVGAHAAEVLDTFVYYQGILGGDWGLAAAAGLFKGLVGTVLVLGANRVAKRLGTGGLF